MATTLPQPVTDLGITDDDPERLYLTPEEGRQMFEDAVQQWMGIGTEEFIQRWEAGEYWGIADEAGYRHIGDLIMMLPLARQEP